MIDVVAGVSINHDLEGDLEMDLHYGAEKERGYRKKGTHEAGSGISVGKSEGDKGKGWK